MTPPADEPQNCGTTLGFFPGVGCTASSGGWMLRILWVSVVVVLVATHANAQVELVKAFDESVVLDVDNSTTKRLVGIESLLAEQKWSEAVTALRQTQTERPHTLVPLAAGWYVNVMRYVQCRVATLPPEGLAEYRRQVDRSAETWWRATESSSNDVGCRRIEREAFCSSFGRLAMVRLANDRFESGDFAGARTVLEKLLPAAPTLRSAAGIGLLRTDAASQDEAAQMRAQLVMCSLFSGDLIRAEREIIAFRTLHSESIGSLQGEQLPLAGQLERMLSEAKRPANAVTSAISTTENTERTAWRVELPTAVWSESADQNVRPAEHPIDLFPVIAHDTVFVSNGESIFALDSTNGRPKWSDADDSTVSTSAAAIYSLADPVRPKRPVIGRHQTSLTIQGDRLFARLGTPITGRAKQEQHSESELVALDVGIGEGQLIWRVAAEQVPTGDVAADVAPWCFDGSPVTDDRRVFVALRRSLPQEQINVACFDADTARLLWNRKVAISVNSTDEATNTTSHLRLVLAEDSLFASTDAGAIAALDVDDGSIRWLRTYRSETPAIEDRREGGLRTFYHDGVLFVAPLDTNWLFAIHAESGLLLWDREWPDPIQHILGGDAATLVVQGRALWGIKMDSGEHAWNDRRVGFDDPEGFSAGCGVIVNDTILWPTSDEVFEVSVASGRILRRTLLSESVSKRLGHLTIAGNSLVLSRGLQLEQIQRTRIVR